MHLGRWMAPLGQVTVVHLVKCTKFIFSLNGTWPSGTSRHSAKWYPRLLYKCNILTLDQAIARAENNQVGTISLPHKNDEFYDEHQISSATFVTHSLLNKLIYFIIDSIVYLIILDRIMEAGRTSLNLLKPNSCPPGEIFLITRYTYLVIAFIEQPFWIT